MSRLSQPTPDTLDELKEAHVQPLTLLGIEDEHFIVVRKPSPEEWAKFRRYAQDPAVRNKAPESLLRDVLVYPAWDVFAEELKHTPGLTESFAGEVVSLAGFTQKVEKKAL
jgi:hypothetical protein